MDCLTSFDMRFLYSIGAHEFDVWGGSLAFQHIIDEFGTEEEKERLARMNVGYRPEYSKQAALTGAAETLAREAERLRKIIEAEPKMYDDCGAEIRPTTNDSILNWMRSRGMKLSKANYVRNAYWDANHKLGAEEEASLPPELTD